MSQGSSVRMGRAAVEVVGDLAPLRSAVATVPSVFEGVAASVATSTATSTAISTASAVKTVAAVKGVSTTMGGVVATTTASGRTHGLVGTMASAAWRSVTRHVTVMTAAIWAANAGVKALGLQSTGVGKLLSMAFSNRRLIGGGGIIASLAGALTGSSTLKAAGAFAGRTSIGLSVVEGFNRSGFRGALTASLGAGVKYAAVQGVAGSVSVVRRGVLGAIALPGAAVSGAVSGLASLNRGILRLVPGTKAARAAADETTAALQRGGGIGAAVGAQFGGFTGGLKAFAGMAMLKIDALGAAITVAAGQFMNRASEIKAKAKETGESIGSLVQKQYKTSLAGALISDDDINRGAEMKDAFTTLGGVIQVAWAQVGAAVAPVMLSFFRDASAVVQGIAVWANQNRELIVTGFKVAAVVVHITAAVAAAYGAFMLLGPAVGLVLNPFTLLTGAVVGGIAAWATYSEEGKASLGAVTSAATEVQSVMTTAIGGIVDALAAGDMSLAAEIGLDGVKAAFVEVSAATREIWTNVTTSMSNWLVDSGFMESINTAVSHVENAFTRLKEWFNGWVIWFQEKLSVISEQQAKAMKEENSRTANAAVETRTRQMEAENRQFRNNPTEVKQEIKRESDARIEAIRAERDAAREAAREKLAASVNQAADARKKKDAELAATAAARNTGAVGAMMAVKSNPLQFGAAGASRQGPGYAFRLLEKLNKKVADNTGRIADAIDGGAMAIS